MQDTGFAGYNELARHRWGLGLRLLAHDRLRLLGSWAGLAVAVTIMFVQLGLLQAILDSQALVATLVRGDLVVMNQVRSNLHNWNQFEPVRLSQIAALPQVKSVVPVYQGVLRLRDPDSGALRNIVAFAFPPEWSPLAIGDPEFISRTLRLPNTVLFDRLSRNIYGAVAAGQDMELDGAIYKVGGFVAIGPDIVSDGAVVMSDGSWLAADPTSKPIMGVIRLNPGENAAAAQREIQAQIPDDVLVRTPAEIRQRENDFTLGSAPIGILFGIGVLAGFVIGAITCYQTLFNEIMDRLPQYATLRAMGFSDLYLQRVIFEQALLLACGGFAMGLICALVANAYIGGRTSLPMQLSLSSTAWTFALTAGMSLFAGWIAMRLLASARPDELY